MTLESGFLVRNIRELAAALLNLMGLRDGDEALEDVAIEAERHLGMPIALLEQMSPAALLSFVTMKGGHSPRRMMLAGLVIAARTEQAAEADQDGRADDLRPKAIALLSKAFTLEPALESDDTLAVLHALLEDARDAAAGDG